MKQFKTREGQLLQIGNSLDLVLQLRNGSRFDGHLSVPDYMMAFAEREHIYSGVTIRASYPQIFIDDLISCGYLEEV